MPPPQAIGFLACVAILASSCEAPRSPRGRSQPAPVAAEGPSPPPTPARQAADLDTPRPVLLSDRRPSIGDIAYTQSDALFATSSTTYTRLREFLLAGDKDGVVQMAVLGMVGSTPAFTQCRVIKYHGGLLSSYYEVRLMNGPFARHLAFIDSNYLRRPR